MCPISSCLCHSSPCPSLRRLQSLERSVQRPPSEAPRSPCKTPPLPRPVPEASSLALPHGCTPSSCAVLCIFPPGPYGAPAFSPVSAPLRSFLREGEDNFNASRCPRSIRPVEVTCVGQRRGSAAPFRSAAGCRDWAWTPRLGCSWGSPTPRSFSGYFANKFWSTRNRSCVRFGFGSRRRESEGTATPASSRQPEELLLT